MSTEQRSSAVTPALSPEARSLYVRAVQTGGRLTERDAGSLSPGQIAGPLQELLAIGLLQAEVGPSGTYAVKDPQQLAESLTLELQQEAGEILRRSVSIHHTLQDLNREYQSYISRPEAGGSIAYVQGRGNINQRLATLMANGAKEMLTAQPGGGRGEDALKIAIARDLKFVERGGTIRTIYQPSARYSNPTVSYVQAVTQEGCQVRTLDEAFAKLIVIDRQVAVVTVGDEENRDRAAFIRDDSVIDYIVGVFNSQWERAIPFTGDHGIPPLVVTRMRRQIVRMMLEGIAHRTIARRLGLSERTLARHIAEMREEYGVDTLFQLGWKLAQTEGPTA
ncbi:helix-turn-helix domain-containing protein [Kitasatospora sp. NPDC004615]|uniref:helix-turn-helix domain-containing protein n=1 Tax=unclassified Kitasatospora TaxID=2633591 RepID=UPI0036C6BE4B